MKKLKERWEVTSNWQLIVIFIVFAFTGSTSAKLSGPFVEYIGITKELGLWLYWASKLLLIFPIYQVLLLLFGWLFGEFYFFWTFEKKMLKALGLGFILK